MRQQELGGGAAAPMAPMPQTQLPAAAPFSMQAGVNAQIAQMRANQAGMRGGRLSAGGLGNRRQEAQEYLARQVLAERDPSYTTDPRSGQERRYGAHGLTFSELEKVHRFQLEKERLEQQSNTTTRPTRITKDAEGLFISEAKKLGFGDETFYEDGQLNTNAREFLAIVDDLGARYPQVPRADLIRVATKQAGLMTPRETEIKRQQDEFANMDPVKRQEREATIQDRRKKLQEHFQKVAEGDERYGFGNLKSRQDDIKAIMSELSGMGIQEMTPEDVAILPVGSWFIAPALPGVPGAEYPRVLRKEVEAVPDTQEPVAQAAQGASDSQIKITGRMRQPEQGPPAAQNTQGRASDTEFNTVIQEERKKLGVSDEDPIPPKTDIKAQREWLKKRQQADEQALSRIVPRDEGFTTAVQEERKKLGVSDEDPIPPKTDIKAQREWLKKRQQADEAPLEKLISKGK